MTIQKTEALILKTARFRETSLITTFLTREFGKIKALSKGVRKEGSNLLTTYEPFNHVQVVFYEKTRSEVHFVSECSLVHYFAGLRRDFDKIGWASFLAELADAVLPLHEKNPAVFQLLLEVLHRMEEESPARLVSFFEVKLLVGSGFFPQLAACMRCGARDFSTGYLSFLEGWVLCETCRTEARGEVAPLSKGLINAIHFLAEGDLVKALKLRISREMEAELRDFIYRWVRAKYEIDLATVRFLREVEKTQST